MSKVLRAFYWMFTDREGPPPEGRRVGNNSRLEDLIQVGMGRKYPQAWDLLEWVCYGPPWTVS